MLECDSRGVGSILTAGQNILGCRCCSTMVPVVTDIHDTGNPSVDRDLCVDM